MRRGFTLLELMIVVIIIGTLATLGVMQYAGAIEKARGAEAKQIAGQLRTLCAVHYMENTAVTDCTEASLMIGTGAGETPSSCVQTSHYFSYGIATASNTLTITATRCTVSGKSPTGPVGTLTLATDYSTGVDTWGGTGGY